MENNKKQRKNLMFLALTNNLIGTIILFENEDKSIVEQEVKEVIDYDSQTRVFTIEFTNGNIEYIPDKTRYLVKVKTKELHDIIRKKPNRKKRRNVKFKK